VIYNRLNDEVMETVFDYNITPEEWENIHGGAGKERYLQLIGEESANFDLALLFYRRGDKEKATYYANKLPFDYRNDFWRLVTHP
jgi:hypothetical protein